MKRYDEMPALISLFLLYIFSVRYWALSAGWASSVNITNFGFDQMSDAEAVNSLLLGTLGQSIFLGTYMITQRKKLAVKAHTLSRNTGLKLRKITFVLSALVVPVAVAVRSYVSEQKEAGVSMAFDFSSYLILFPFAVSGVAILIIAALKLGAFSTLELKLTAFFVLALILFVSFGSGARFQFAGWLIAGVIILGADTQPIKRVPIYFIGFAIVAVAFGIAGTLRDIKETSVSTSEIKEAAWKGLLTGRDANMLDGLALVQQVYPLRLEYGYGMEHLEILTRPIPRALWPDKPVGGYMNKLKIFDERSAGTLGISPSLFGSFYGEGGVVGIVFFSIIYGFVLARLMMLTKRIHPLSGALLRGCLFAGIFPLLRGGDLPGIYAWIGMAFWPCGVGLFYCRRELKKDKLSSHFRLRKVTKRSPRGVQGLSSSMATDAVLE